MVDPDSSDDTFESQSEPDTDVETSVDSDAETKVCAICLEHPTFAVVTPCGHTFCYLCLKGVLHTGHQFQCPYCRTPLNSSVLQNLEDELHRDADVAQQPIWLYRAKSSGWWLFDKETTEVLEKVYHEHTGQGVSPVFDLRICGILFEMNVETMKQTNKTNGAVRKIQRVAQGTDLTHINIRGVAGVAYTDDDT